MLGALQVVYNQAIDMDPKRILSYSAPAFLSLLLGIAIGLKLNNDQSEPISVAVEQQQAAAPPLSTHTDRLDSTNAIVPDWNQSIRESVQAHRPENILAELQASSSGSHQRALIPLVMQYWADEDSHSALSYALQMDAEEDQLELVAIALAGMAKSAPESAVEWVELFENPREQDYLYAAIYSAYAEHHPAEAMTAAQALQAGHRRDFAMAEVAAVWAKQDAEAVFNWLETQPLNRQLQDIYGAAMVDYMQQEPEVAGAIIQELFPSDQQTVLACQYAHMLAKNDIEQALNWVASLPDGPAKTESLGLTIGQWLEVDSEAAFQYALTSDSDLQITLLKRAALNQASLDPAAAAHSLNRFPEATRAEVASDIALLWAQQEPDAVINWIDELEDTDVQQQAVRGAIEPLLNRTPEIAYQLAATVNGGARVELMHYTAKRWHEIDPGAVIDAVQSDPELTPDQKQQLLSSVSTNSATMDILLP
ncbi:hypothetical protein [Coraliomargarita akajimensis]|uniref:Uncharacterized protein n=1 Tax=Coraliomargarita akajimensis (strain DSM 45221 / IAM 15411 / JCM 23193 / KCTC 12865 / 04OKA010-24) TaxID=583355 RepID=D5EII9_CORAD|nr:hypothetical protein [Coraliomargarita akajimensis]ADE54255.1 hypothetical protein Caka_1235 [Coraliomargarita akajimensis DSM 45221]